MDLSKFERSHIKETLIDCRTDMRDAGLGELLRASDQYDAILTQAQTLNVENARLREVMAGLLQTSGRLSRSGPLPLLDEMRAREEMARAALKATV